MICYILLDATGYIPLRDFSTETFFIDKCSKSNYFQILHAAMINIKIFLNSRKVISPALTKARGKA